MGPRDPPTRLLSRALFTSTPSVVSSCSASFRQLCRALLPRTCHPPPPLPLLLLSAETANTPECLPGAGPGAEMSAVPACACRIGQLPHASSPSGVSRHRGDPRSPTESLLLQVQ